jgi:hypothetical protein
MTNPMIRIHNQETDEIIDREMTAEELAQWEADKIEQAARQETKALKAAEEAARLSAKLAIYAKLGLTEEEINTLIS